MDATTKRRTRKITFDGQKMGVYKPTEGQMAMIGVATSSGGAGGKDLRRLFEIMSALCVDPEQWAAIEDGMVSGRLDIPDLMRFVKQMFEYEWPLEPKPTKAARATAARRPAEEPELPDGKEDDDDEEDDGE